MKTKNIVLSAAFLLSIAACKSQEDEWTDGKENGRYRDTVANGNHYRHYGGLWYPIMMGGMINPYRYQGATYNDISRPGYTPVRTSRATRWGGRTGGFGRSGGGSFGG